MKKNIKANIIIFIALWAILVFSIFWWVNLREDEQVERVNISQAEALFQQVVDMRSWNSDHGGVYVKVDEKTQPNPYLGVPYRDIFTRDGQMYTLINPAFMTRQVGEIGRVRHDISVHITSLNPLRPENTPSDWEKASLKAFEEGKKVRYGFADESGRDFFRYMKPLTVEKSCLECHGSQGYSVGDIRGGISVSFPVDALLKSRSDFRRQSSLALVTIWILGAGMFTGISLYFREKNREVEKYRGLALVDELTGLNNRRAFNALVDNQLETAERFSEKALLLFVDVDGMKFINDNYGHDEGDKVLRSVTEVLLSSVRGSDIVARYGGDEFVVFMPKSSMVHRDLAVARVHQLMDSRNSVTLEDYKISVSIGATEFDPVAPVSIDTLLKQADMDLYGKVDDSNSA